MSQLEIDRRTKLDKIRALGLDPFGYSGLRLEPIHSVICEFKIKIWDNLTKENSPRIAVSGRIMLRRGMGKLSFLTIQNDGYKIQVALDVSRLNDTDQQLSKLLDLGDHIAVEGILFPTKTQECTIWADKLFITSKSLIPPPDKVHGLEDYELRYRNRHIDLLSQDVRNVFTTRTKIVKTIRRYMEDCGYVEVETPILMNQAGGATAKPFCTHHNALDADMVLRIAPELYLKRLVAGGFSQVFEIGKNFRNEGISPRHNPEFTFLEAYKANANYKDMMSEVRSIVQVTASVSKKEFNSEWNVVRLDQLIDGDMPIEKKYEIFENEVSHKLINPTFVTHMPKSVVPLAKESKEFPGCAEMFELYINGQEIAPGYTEENDPNKQLVAFQSQVKHGHVLDEDFVEVLKFGMPPAGGFGIGLDRLVALLVGVKNIRDVILFPTLRSIKPKSSNDINT